MASQFSVSHLAPEKVVPGWVGRGRAAATKPAESVTAGELARFLVKAARPGFWLTSLWFYLLPLRLPWPVHHLAFWVGLFYVGFPLGLTIYGSNDLSDQKTDALNPRKGNFLFGARPTPAQAALVPRAIVAVQLPFLAYFGWFNPLLLVWALAGWVATWFYNSPKRGAKDKPGWDALAQGSFVLVFVLSCCLNGQPVAALPVVFVRGTLRDAFAPFRAGHGSGARL